MKTTKLFFIAFLICFSSKICTAQTAEHKTYDYITMVAFGNRPEYLNVSINGEKYQEIKLNKTRNEYDYNEVIKIINQFEKEGYEVFTSNMLPTNEIYREIYFLLRREHKK